jgi:hypothetical protein
MFLKLSPLERVELLGASMAATSALAAFTIGGPLLSLLGVLGPVFYLGVAAAAMASRRTN